MNVRFECMDLDGCMDRCLAGWQAGRLAGWLGGWVDGGLSGGCISVSSMCICPFVVIFLFFSFISAALKRLARFKSP